MDITSLYYFTELAKDLNMKKTSSRLFITQQTLSNHIIRLEKEYDILFFTRYPKLALTLAGEEMLRSAKNILREEHQIKNIVGDIKGQETGIIRFGAGAQRTVNLLSAVLPAFTKYYPKVSLNLTDTLDYRLKDALLNGELDLAVTSNIAEHPMLTYEIITQYPIYLCVADSLLEEYYTKEEIAKIKKNGRSGIKVADIAKIPILMLESPNKVGLHISDCYIEAGLKPNTYISARYTQLTPYLCASGTAGCFMSQISLLNNLCNLNNNVNIFPVLYKETLLLHTLGLVRVKKGFQPKFTLYFIQLLKEHIKTKFTTDLTYIVN